MRILMIEDDERLCESVTYQLKQEGYSTDCCHDGSMGLSMARRGIYDIILLDRMLPEISGTMVLERIRNEGIQTPVIVVTALGQLEERVEGLNLGADDYLVKPFAFCELLARINSVARRPRKMEMNTEVRQGDISLAIMERTLDGPKGQCSLSKKEGALLEFFMKNFTRILTREVLLYRVWGPDGDVEDGNLDNYIHFLRRRLKSVGSSIQIKTFRGTGYKMEI